MGEVGALTSPDFWTPSDDRSPSARFWSPFDPSFTDILRLLRKHVSPGDSFLEMGCAPGKYLAAAAIRMGATVSGVDYCPAGISTARRYFGSLGITADLRCEDMMATSFAPDTFDCVFSMGLIEHFEDPARIVAKHYELVRPGGTVIILVPNYGGIWGIIETRFWPEGMAVHNTKIMRPASLLALAPDGARSDYFGRPSPWILNMEKIMPVALAQFLQRGLGMASVALPLPASRLSPMLALVGRKAG
jgi:SAM-dependent methyltransferase